MGSWERDVGRAEKQKRKNIFFFCFRAKPFLIPRLVLQIHSWVYVLRVCVVCYVEGRDIPTCQECGSRLRKRLSSKCISLQARTHFQWWWLVQEQFHSCVCYVRLVLSWVKANYSLSSNWSLSRKRIPHSCCYWWGMTLPSVSSVILLCVVDFQ